MFVFQYRLIGKFTNVVAAESKHAAPQGSTNEEVDYILTGNWTFRHLSLDMVHYSTPINGNSYEQICDTL